MIWLIRLSVWFLVGWAFAKFILSPAFGGEAFEDKIHYVCDRASYYITTPLEKCLKEQRNWRDLAREKARNDKEWRNALWYGERYNYMGEVVGLDFYYVYERLKYISKK